MFTGFLVSFQVIDTFVVGIKKSSHEMGAVICKRWGLSINYVVSVGGQGRSPKDDLLHSPILNKKDEKGGGGKK